MSIHFKLVQSTDPAVRRDIERSLAAAGFPSRPLFPHQRRSRLATIHTIPDGSKSTIARVRTILEPFKDAVEYIEVAPSRSPK
jgi:hypothetical protein